MKMKMNVIFQFFKFWTILSFDKIANESFFIWRIQLFDDSFGWVPLPNTLRQLSPMEGSFYDRVAEITGDVIIK